MEQLKTAEVQMDCMAVAMTQPHYLPQVGRWIPRSRPEDLRRLPYIKRVAVSHGAALHDRRRPAGIGHIRDFYAKAYPGVLKDSKPSCGCHCGGSAGLPAGRPQMRVNGKRIENMAARSSRLLSLPRGNT
jgi:hypothetical protein